MSYYSKDLLVSGQPFNISSKKHCTGDDMPYTHYHSHFEIYYQISGDRYYFLKDRTYHINEGTIILINPSYMHKTLEATKPVGERILINFEKSFLESLAKDRLQELLDLFKKASPFVHPTFEQKEKFDHLFIKLIDEFNNDNDCLYVQILLLELLLLIERYQTPENDSAMLSIPFSSKYEKVSQVATYISEHYAQNLTLDDLANTFYLNPSYLSRLFKEGTGHSPIQYLNYIRVSHAKLLLKQKDLTISDISEQVGFNSLTHFGRTFKTFTGTTPSRYRHNISLLQH